MANVYRPIDVLEKQVEVITWWQRSPFAKNHAEPFQYMVDAYSAMWHLVDGKMMRTKLEEYLPDRLNRAETFFVRSNIIDRLWTFADVHQAHEHETIERRDLPCERGFMWLDKTIYIRDAQGQKCSVKAISWFEESNGVTMIPWSDPRDPQDEINQGIFAKYGAETALRTQPPVALMHINSWTWGRRIINLAPEDFTIPEPRTPEYLANVEIHKWENAEDTSRLNGFLVSMWEFVQEQIPLRYAADRPMRKRLHRAHSPLSEVTVVELRPYDQPTHYDPDHVPEIVVWAGRWRQREHKRRWIDKKGNYRETTVAACVKGPVHLPIIEKDRVFDVKR